jgi:NADH:ubiquinone oxidoreductase subunit 4 (subunit M)
MYLLYMTGKLCFGPERSPEGHRNHTDLPKDLNLREILALAPLALICLILGLVPWPILHAVEAPAEEILKPYPALVRELADPGPVAHTHVLVEDQPKP